MQFVARAYRLMRRNLPQASTPILLDNPSLRAVLLDGIFSFDKVDPDQPYHVIGIKLGDEGRPIVMVVKTPRLRPGWQLTLTLSENDPWTGPVMQSGPYFSTVEYPSLHGQNLSWSWRKTGGTGALGLAGFILNRSRR